VVLPKVILLKKLFTLLFPVPAPEAHTVLLRRTR